MRLVKLICQWIISLSIVHYKSRVLLLRICRLCDITSALLKTFFSKEYFVFFIKKYHDIGHALYWWHCTREFSPTVLGQNIVLWWNIVCSLPFDSPIYTLDVSNYFYIDKKFSCYLLIFMGRLILITLQKKDYYWAKL